ncbi:murein L,D-transpeptidase [Rhizobium sp. S153]|uniref:Murein L,D-transpeptidase n=1 Tax=Ciceribacter sichuanensis TaxID=2949647 RepID=A0ABT0V971_9HYPH|nr:murein L,D-transpeptidase family protein [Ciceribacter sp. S153]MCM2402422.1 murein L,D-transpeptidase [Ciceribacter sp. S153]
MRWKSSVLVLTMAALLAGCTVNETLETVDLSQVKDKVDHPLSPKILADMQAKGMERNSPIAIRIFKEEGVLEIWKAKTDNRFEKIKEYAICAWSGRLGPKIKEGDRQAPEGFYPLSPQHLNPNSKYYLAINTGFPNRYDSANGRNGTNLMIHGACSSAGCYSMTDEQILEIYAFARDAFKGGQQTIQLQAFPFRMTAENMARHRASPHFEFWQMLKAGYDNFEVTKRPPEVAVCGKKYVFNQQVEGGKGMNAGAACPPMSTPPALQMALNSYNKTYQMAYDKALKKLGDKVWYDPTEAERKAIVADQRKGHDLAYAPTGSALKAGKLVSLEDAEKIQTAQSAAPTSAPAAIARMAAAKPNQSTPAPAAQPPQQTAAAVGAAASGTTTAPQGTPAAVPVPQPNPLTATADTATDATAPAQETAQAEKKPFWKFWQTQ